MRSVCGIPIALVATACLSPLVSETEVDSTESFPLDRSERTTLVIVMDDTESTLDVYGRTSNASGNFYDALVSGNRSFNVLLGSTYVDVEAPWPGEIVVSESDIEGDDGWNNSLFQIDFLDLMGPNMRTRERTEPSARQAMSAVLDSPRIGPLVQDAHLLFLVVTAFHDHSGETADLPSRLDALPYGATVMLLTPQSDGCQGDYSIFREGHDATRKLLGDRIVVDGDTCDRESFQDVIAAMSDVEGPQSSITVDLDEQPIAGSVVVTGLGPGVREILPSAQWAVNGTTLDVRPPLRGFDTVEVSYTWEVE